MATTEPMRGMKMGSNKRKQGRRTRLFYLNNKCIYCGVDMVLPESLEYIEVRGRKLLKEEPDNMCTIEHTQHRGSDLKGGYSTTIICCKKCNNERQPNK